MKYPSLNLAYLISKGKTAIVTGMLLLFATTPTFAQGGPYELEWGRVDGGITTSSGGDYSLTGVTGQPEAGPTMSDSTGQYSLTGGFVGVAPGGGGGGEGGNVYLPLIIK